MLFGEPLAQLCMAQNVRPELEEDREPAVLGAAAGGGCRRDPLESLDRRARLREGRLDVRQCAVHSALVDREEQVLLGHEVGVDGALGVAGVVRDLVHRGGVEALLGEEPLGRVQQLRAGLCPALLAGECGSHTVSIQIPTVFVNPQVLP